MSTLEMINVIVTIVIFLAVTLAMGQVIVFDLTAKSTKNLDLHKGITYIGMGAAGYALFGARAHFSQEGWVGLVLGVLGIVGVGVMIQKFRKRNDPRPPVPENKIASHDPDETISWCRKCREHTTTRKKTVHSSDGTSSWRKEVCAHCGGGVFVPVGNRQASYGCSGCAMVPVAIAAIALLWKSPAADGQLGYAIAAVMALFILIIVPFPVVFLYQYRKWLNWSRERRMDPSL
ncbi:MAG: hypothetical protein OSB47_07700 [Pirellulaceae bacterium]|nr:hypothetical protein [Pirellulaceae bacterium]